MDLRSPGSSIVARVMTSCKAGTSNADSVVISDYIGCGSGGILGSSILTTRGASCSPASTPWSSTFSSRSISGRLTSSSYDSSPTPGISTYPMIRSCLSVKVNYVC